MDEMEKILERNARRRIRAENRFLSGIDRKLEEADKLVGEMSRDGDTVYYINVRSMKGHLTGASKEFEYRFQATDYLIRNNYV